METIWLIKKGQQQLTLKSDIRLLQAVLLNLNLKIIVLVCRSTVAWFQVSQFDPCKWQRIVFMIVTKLFDIYRTILCTCMQLVDCL